MLDRASVTLTCRLSRFFSRWVLYVYKLYCIVQYACPKRMSAGSCMTCILVIQEGFRHYGVHTFCRENDVEIRRFDTQQNPYINKNGIVPPPLILFFHLLFMLFTSSQHNIIDHVKNTKLTGVPNGEDLGFNEAAASAAVGDEHHSGLLPDQGRNPGYYNNYYDGTATTTTTTKTQEHRNSGGIRVSAGRGLVVTVQTRFFVVVVRQHPRRRAGRDPTPRPPA